MKAEPKADVKADSKANADKAKPSTTGQASDQKAAPAAKSSASDKAAPAAKSAAEREGSSGSRARPRRAPADDRQRAGWRLRPAQLADRCRRSTLTTEQKTKIRTTVLQSSSAPKVSRSSINFNISVGTVVPRSVHFVTVPDTLVRDPSGVARLQLLHRRRRDHHRRSADAADRRRPRGLTAQLLQPIEGRPDRPPFGYMWRHGTQGRNQRRPAGLSAGGNEIEFLLAHPGGPYWARKDDGAWTIPKGLVRPDDLLTGALREFKRRNRIDRARAVRAAPAGPAEERQDRARLRLRSRSRPVGILQQHVRDGMAAALRPAQSSSRRSTGSAGSACAAAMKKIIAYQRPFLIELQEANARATALERASTPAPLAAGTAT